ncbi:Crp/Fnr family transcriptional regulator [Aquimarina algiphila]|uniref:Crp/Fnr family transcriptional regulator n=1 Tax=Aquimarina algiphila TaxID=2047982 RepID=UPI00232C3D15|nr:Crp/Fnr family transcriptional regulator [Aquimarina algiphila]
MINEKVSSSDALKKKIIAHIQEKGNSPIVLKRKEYLIREGRIENSMYIVERGSLRIFVNRESEEITLRFGYRGSWMTSFPSFLSRTPSLYNIQAIKECYLLQIDRDDFFDFIASTKENQALWTKMLEEFAIQQLERELDISIRTPIERYDRLLKRSPHVFQEIPNKYIASYLRMNPETLSRLKKR